LWCDARVRGALSRIAHRVIACIKLLVHRNQKMPMK
jgi:hypothetical protein